MVRRVENGQYIKGILRYVLTSFTLVLLLYIAYNIGTHTEETSDASVYADSGNFFLSPSPVPTSVLELEEKD